MSAPPGVARRSLALYYYTNTWEPAVQAHTTLYYISQTHKVRIRVSRIVRGLILDLIPPIFRKVVRAVKRAIQGEKLTELWDYAGNGPRDYLDAKAGIFASTSAAIFAGSAPAAG